MTVAEFKEFLTLNEIPDYSEIKVSGLDGIDIPAISISINKSQDTYNTQEDKKCTITLRATRYN